MKCKCGGTKRRTSTGTNNQGQKYVAYVCDRCKTSDLRYWYRGAKTPKLTAGRAGDQELVALLDAGCTLQEIATELGCSRERIRQRARRAGWQGRRWGQGLRVRPDIMRALTLLPTSRSIREAAERAGVSQHALTLAAKALSVRAQGMMPIDYTARWARAIVAAREVTAANDGVLRQDDLAARLRGRPLPPCQGGPWLQSYLLGTVRTTWPCTFKELMTMIRTTVGAVDGHRRPRKGTHAATRVVDAAVDAGDGVSA